jgi:deoxyribodipyrimidine photo-lyase
VEPAAAARQARDRLWARRRQPGFRERADAILQQHGSRRSGRRARGGGQRVRPGTAADQSQGPIQLGLEWEGMEA